MYGPIESFEVLHSVSVLYFNMYISHSHLSPVDIRVSKGFIPQEGRRRFDREVWVPRTETHRRYEGEGRHVKGQVKGGQVPSAEYGSQTHSQVHTEGTTYDTLIVTRQREIHLYLQTACCIGKHYAPSSGNVSKVTIIT